MLDSILQAVLLFVSAATVVHLLRSGLSRKYPVFFVYFLVRTPYVLAPIILNVKSPTYFRLWLWAEPLFCVLYVLVVFELYRLVLANYKGLHTVGRWAMYVISAISVTISALTLLPRLRSAKGFAPFWYVMGFERGVDTSLVIFLLLMLLFLSRYPIRLSRNVRVYAFVYPVFFLSSTLGMLLFTVFGIDVGEAVNSAMSALSIVSTAAFLLLLKPSGETVPKVESTVTPEHAQILLTRLETLNSTLLRVSRR